MSWRANRQSLSMLLRPTYLDPTRSSASREFSDIDILVNNAGAIPPGSLSAIDDDTWRRAWDLKVFGFIGLCRAYYPLFARRRSGVIVNVIGSAGESLDPGYIAGVTGNAALMAFTRAMGRASHKDNIRIVGINPGSTATERMELMLRERCFQATALRSCVSGAA
jgi:NAD(P)-dependent dehydrogenase (short-subunit alcohol dehydrogenase family)